MVVVLHGSSVGEASARQTSHCPKASKDAGNQGRPGIPGLRVFLMWLRFSDLSRRAVLKLGPVGESVSDRFAIVGHFSAPGEMAFSFPASFSRLQKGIWNPKTISLLVRAANRGRDGCDPVAVPSSIASPALLPHGGERGGGGGSFPSPQNQLTQ